LFLQVPDALILSLKRRIKHSAWLYMLQFIATFLSNWHITPWQHNASINRNKLWNSYLVCAIRHCSRACLVHNFRYQWYTVILIAKYLFTGSLKNRSIDNLKTQKKYISMENSQFFNYLLYANRNKLEIKF
jgi:hypothetical protein